MCGADLAGIIGLRHSASNILRNLACVERGGGGYKTESLRLVPGQPASLYGRGIAKRRLGETQEGDVDIAAAVKNNERVTEQFSSYGVMP
jgi:hypothetical protein